jgi:hypothetical protein
VDATARQRQANPQGLQDLTQKAEFPAQIRLKFEGIDYQPVNMQTYNLFII